MKWSTKIADLLKDLPQNVAIGPTAEKDLARVLKKNFREFEQIFKDLIRLGSGTLPPAGRKKLKIFDAWQMDAGRYRVVFRPQADGFFILAVFSKPEQKKRFHSL